MTLLSKKNYQNLKLTSSAGRMVTVRRAAGKTDIRSGLKVWSALRSRCEVVLVAAARLQGAVLWMVSRWKTRRRAIGFLSLSRRNAKCAETWFHVLKSFVSWAQFNHRSAKNIAVVVGPGTPEANVERGRGSVLPTSGGYRVPGEAEGRKMVVGRAGKGYGGGGAAGTWYCVDSHLSINLSK